MKRFVRFFGLLFLLLACSTITASATSGNDSFYVNGNQIYDPCGGLFNPRGINYSVLDDWNFPTNLSGTTELSTQIVQANPNIVRITWWRDYAGRPAYSITNLDTVISRFAAKGVVCIVTLMDQTGWTDTTSFKDSITAWWTSTAVAALVKRHQNTMIVNIANEWGSSSALTSYEIIYKEAITAIRNAGIIVPLLIDGPDYANNISAIGTVGTIFESYDPLHNIIMSCHA